MSDFVKHLDSSCLFLASSAHMVRGKDEETRKGIKVVKPAEDVKVFFAFSILWILL